MGPSKFPEDGVTRTSAIKVSDRAFLLTLCLFFVFFFHEDTSNIRLLPFRRVNLKGANSDSSSEAQNNGTPI